jgi:hypothetical protein
MNAAEYQRCRRVIEWMHTAHSTMRDRNMRLSRALTLVVMALSIVSLLLALANGDQHVSLLGVQGKLQVFVAWLAALIFFVSLLNLVVDWRALAWRHGDAAGRLGELNAVFRRAVPDANGALAVEGLDLGAEYQRVMASLVPLPEKKVMALKALHNRKRATFTRADENPGAPAWWIRLQVLRTSLAGRSTIEARARAADGSGQSGTDK